MEKQKIVVTVSGKGGVGKTTFTALMLKVLSEGGGRSIFAVDANPDSNLAEVLGIPIGKTVGMIANKLKDDIDRGLIPPSMTKKDLLEYGVFSTLKEMAKFDLLVMGRTEGEGCYCMVNNLLTSILDTLSKNYDVTLMDMEAGLEHLSRRTDRNVDFMIVIVNLSRTSLETAKRIKELAREVHIEFKKMFLVGNKIDRDSEELLAKKAEEVGIELAGIMPYSHQIALQDLKEESLLNLPPTNEALIAVKKIGEKIGLI